jgi:PEP-CTERM motif
MKIRNNVLSITAALLASATLSQAQSIVTAWTFENDGPAGFNPSPAPSTGSGIATVLGMDNSYGTPGSSTNISDIYANDATDSDPSSAFVWRIRGGPNTATAANGWSSLAPIGTQGVEFDASTAGFSNIQISFDLETTKQAEANMELEYTTDGTTWNNAAITYAADPGLVKVNSTSANTVMGTYISFSSTSTTFWNGITADLSGISAANNDPNFGIRIVNASTGADDINCGGTAYNNSSGNWRVDNVTITSVPEPSTFALAGLGLAALLKFRRRI